MSSVATYQLAVHLTGMERSRRDKNRLHRVMIAAGGLTHKSKARAHTAACDISTDPSVEWVNVSRVTATHIFRVHHAVHAA